MNMTQHVLLYRVLSKRTFGEHQGRAFAPFLFQLKITVVKHSWISALKSPSENRHILILELSPSLAKKSRSVPHHCWFRLLWTGSSSSCGESPSCEQIHLEVLGEVRDKKGFLHLSGHYYTRLWTNVTASKCFQTFSLYKHAKFGGVPEDCQPGKIVRIHTLDL